MWIFSIENMKFCDFCADIYIMLKKIFANRDAEKAAKKLKKESDPSGAEALSIKERVAAANYAIKVKGDDSEDKEVNDVIGEVYGG